MCSSCFVSAWKVCRSDGAGEEEEEEEGVEADEAVEEEEEEEVEEEEEEESERRADSCGRAALGRGADGGEAGLSSAADTEASGDDDSGGAAAAAAPRARSARARCMVEGGRRKKGYDSTTRHEVNDSSGM